ncbi:MAG TPA: hypothetical protein VHI54_09585 [Actinomycetota bacterium]|nr:hypothetical protein [Actinomycetota bacterium]
MSEPEPEFELSSEPEDPDPDESDPGPEFDDPDPESDESDPELDEPLFEEPEPESGEFDSGVDSVDGWLPGARDGGLSSRGDGVGSLGEMTSLGASGAPAGTRSVGVERSRPATTYALNVSVMATAIPPSAQASPFIMFRTDSMVGASVPRRHPKRVKQR